MESQGLLFSGDHIMEGSTVVIQPPDGDLVAYLESLRLLGAMEPPLRAVAPGHGRMIEDPLGVIKDIVQHRRARHDVVKAALAEAGRSDAEGLVDAVYPELGPERRQVATGTLWAHLRALVVEGEAQLEGALPGEEEIFASFSAARSA
jgi:glyoxylase-like metal-dependent hydrolase (beta-lactamase superfamily II)